MFVVTHQRVLYMIQNREIVLSLTNYTKINQDLTTKIACKNACPHRRIHMPDALTNDYQ